MISEIDWYALTILSESNQPHEWEAIAWVIRNRREASGFGGDTYREVTRAPFQFSAWNPYRGSADDEASYAAVRAHYATDHLLSQARTVAEGISQDHRYYAPFGPKVFHYWSPRSMQPAGATPRWNFSALRCFEVSGVDPWRFIFAESVPTGHPLAGGPSRDRFRRTA